MKFGKKMFKEKNKLMDSPVDEEFCDGCCYNDNPNSELRCSKVKCCYLVRNECLLVDGYIVYK